MEKSTNLACLSQSYDFSSLDSVKRGTDMNNNLVLVDNPYFIVDMMYATPDNMSGKAVYMSFPQQNKAYLHKNAYQALLSVIPELAKHHYRMRIRDAYRLPQAHQALFEAVPIPGFFKADYKTSNHCHGTAVDVCLTDENGNNLAFPTEVDAYTKEFQQQVAAGQFAEFQKHLQKARHDYMDADSEALKNRAFLKALMESHGFESIPHEWWHYNLKGWQDYPIIDKL